MFRYILHHDPEINVYFHDHMWLHEFFKVLSNNIFSNCIFIHIFYFFSWSVVLTMKLQNINTYLYDMEWKTYLLS